MEAFLEVPAEVAGSGDDVHFFEQVLADVRDPDRTGFTVEAEPVRVTEAPEVDLGLSFAALIACLRVKFDSDERVVFGDAVGLFAVHVDAQERAEDGRDVLAASERRSAQAALLRCAA